MFRAFKNKLPIFVVSVMFIFGYILLTTIDANLWLFTQAKAYPPPATAVFVPEEAYPAPKLTEYSPTPHYSLPPNYTPNHHLYLPVILKTPPTRFSVAGASVIGLVHQVVPEGVAIDGYIWDNISAGRSIQVMRSCLYYRAKDTNWYFREWYWSHTPSILGHLCWDPINQVIAKIVNHPSCPHYSAQTQRPCLDVEIQNYPLAERGITQFVELVQSHPEWIWLIGNETDNPGQDALVDQIVIHYASGVIEPYNPGGAQMYATFFQYMYDTMLDVFEDLEGSPTPKLVFCQSTYARQVPGSQLIGLDYCRNAFQYLKDNTSPNEAREMIYALSTHQYVDDSEVIGGISYGWGRLLDGQTIATDQGFTGSILEHAVLRWGNYLRQFEDWADSEGMSEKPLWLTEYGSLHAWCFEIHQGELPSTGLKCDGIASIDPQGNHVFYGRNVNEGLWGLQKRQMEYLWQSGRWQAAWWFVSGMEQDVNGICYQTAWLWGADFDCLPPNNYPHPDQYFRSRAGITHFQTINCLANGLDCSSDFPISPDTPPLDPNTHPWGYYCKTTAERPCFPYSLPNPIPTSTPTIVPPVGTPAPTITPTPAFNPESTMTPSCGCNNGITGEECPQVYDC